MPVPMWLGSGFGLSPEVVGCGIATGSGIPIKVCCCTGSAAGSGVLAEVGAAGALALGFLVACGFFAAGAFLALGLASLGALLAGAGLVVAAVLAFVFTPLALAVFFAVTGLAVVVFASAALAVRLVAGFLVLAFNSLACSRFSVAAKASSFLASALSALAVVTCALQLSRTLT